MTRCAAEARWKTLTVTAADASATLQSLPASLVKLVVTASNVRRGQALKGVVSLNGQAPNGGSVVALSVTSAHRASRGSDAAAVGDNCVGANHRVVSDHDRISGNDRHGDSHGDFWASLAQNKTSPCFDTAGFAKAVIQNGRAASFGLARRDAYAYHSRPLRGCGEDQRYPGSFFSFGPGAVV